MKENDIRPEECLKEVLQLHEEDVKDMMKQKNQFVEVDCPCCGETESNFQYDKEGFLFEKCVNCDTIYITPRPTVDMLSYFYAHSRSMHYWNKVMFPKSETYRKERLFRNRALKVVEICEKYGSDFGTIVDVGAGYGTFCEVVKETNKFKRVIAVEPSTGLAETCEKRGIETINIPIEKASLENVSVVTNFEVIEHLFEPEEFVRACSKILPKDGILVITTPNIEGFELKMLKTLSPNVGGPDHLNYFTPYSIRYLLEKCGFDVLEVSTPGRLDAELVRKEIINGNINVSEDGFLKTVLVDHWEEAGLDFQKFLEDNKLSSHMWAIAKKR